MAPLMRTVSPGWSWARSTIEAQQDMPGLAIAAAVTSSRASGSGMVRRGSTRVCSAMAPKGASGMTK